MLFKFIGCACILSSSCVLGFFYAFKIDYRINDLLEMKKALFLLISEIEFTLAPLDEAMRDISLKVKNPVKKIFLEFSESLGKNDLSSGEIWKAVLQKNFDCSYFHQDDIDNFISFGQTLGYLDKKQQNNNIEMAIRYIDQKVPELLQKSAKNKKMYKSLGFFGGIVIMVILF